MNIHPKLLIAVAASALAACATLTDNVLTRSPSEPIDSSAAWSLLDHDADGALSRDEMEQQRAMGLLQDFPNADSDGDGLVSKAEWDAWWPRMTDHHIRDGEDMPAFGDVR